MRALQHIQLNLFKGGHKVRDRLKAAFGARARMHKLATSTDFSEVVKSTRQKFRGQLLKYGLDIDSDDDFDDLEGGEFNKMKQSEV